jgi:hypothetical protein
MQKAQAAYRVRFQKEIQQITHHIPKFLQHNSCPTPNIFIEGALAFTQESQISFAGLRAIHAYRA